MRDVYINDVFYHILDSKDRAVISCGGRDSGKSYFSGQHIPLLMQSEKYFRGIAIRETYTSLKDSVYQEMLDGIHDLGLESIFKSTVSPLKIENKNKNNLGSHNRLIFRGLDDMTKIKSLKGISFILVEEAEKLTERQFMDLLILLRAGDNPQLVLNFNPLDEEHFTNDRYFKVEADEVLETFEDGEKKVWRVKHKVELSETEIITIDILVVRSTYKDNFFIPTVRKAVIESLKNTDPFLYDVYAKGKFGKKGGRILTNTHFLDFEANGLEFNEFDSKGYSQDFGFNHANCILSVATKDNILYVFSEIYVNEKDTDEIIELAEINNISKKIKMKCDSAEPDKIKTWVKRGYNASKVKKYAGSVKAQIDWLKRFNIIYINTKCPNTWKEAKSWSYKLNQQGKFTDEPVEIFDDAMACLRYAKDLFDIVDWGWKK